MRLVQKIDDDVRAWLKFIITIEAGLGIALWSVIAYGDQKMVAGYFKAVVVGLVSLVAVFTPICMFAIIHRARQWQLWYFDCAIEIQRQLKIKVFPVDGRDILPSRMGPILWWLFVLTVIVAGGFAAATIAAFYNLGVLPWKK